MQICSACKPSPPPDITDPGAIIYLGYKDTYASCARCHGKLGQGGEDDVPDIRESIGKLGREKVREIILDGKGTGNKAMPGLAKELSTQEIEQILDFLTTWRFRDSLSIDGVDSSGIKPGLERPPRQ